MAKRKETSPRAKSSKRRGSSRVLRTIGFVLGTLTFFALFYHGSIVLEIFQLKQRVPTTSAMMEIRKKEASSEGRDLHLKYRFVPYEKISKTLVRAVLAGEDARFLDHGGFDWVEMEKAIAKDVKKKSFHRGASSISQQLAKNLFLSPSKNPLRKVHEALITVELENILRKRRILELYLNIIEFGDGIFGVEAASQYYFKTSALRLSQDQAVFLAAIIPNPRTVYNPKKNPGKVAWRKRVVARLMRYISLPKSLR